MYENGEEKQQAPKLFNLLEKDTQELCPIAIRKWIQSTTYNQMDLYEV